jgi:hypothetical protein
MPSERENMQKSNSAKPKKVSPELSEFLHMLEALESQSLASGIAATRAP